MGLTPLHAGSALKDSSVLSMGQAEQATETVCSHQKKFQSYYAVLVTVLSALQKPPHFALAAACEG